jgi:alpha-L-arabinofuranosidase
MMRWIDPAIELAACGSSGRSMPTFGTWEDVVLEHCFDHVDYISLHTYLNNYADDTAAFLASPDLMDAFIEEVVAIADAVAARRRSGKRIMLSFDEWNVWYRTRRNRKERVQEGWPVAPPILEEIYTMADALAFGGACIALLNHADRVKAACLAQLVNVIAPIMTATGGPAWHQTIFHPFAQISKFGRGRVLKAAVDSPTYAPRYYDPRGAQEHYDPLPAVPYLKLAAVHDQPAGRLTVFAVNRHPAPAAGTAGRDGRQRVCRAAGRGGARVAGWRSRGDQRPGDPRADQAGAARAHRRRRQPAPRHPGPRFVEPDPPRGRALGPDRRTCVDADNAWR